MDMDTEDTRVPLTDIRAHRYWRGSCTAGYSAAGRGRPSIIRRVRGDRPRWDRAAPRTAESAVFPARSRSRPAARDLPQRIAPSPLGSAVPPGRCRGIDVIVSGGPRRATLSGPRPVCGTCPSGRGTSIRRILQSAASLDAPTASVVLTKKVVGENIKK